jgi:hypothetical protein
MLMMRIGVAIASRRQHTSAYVSIRQHTSEGVCGLVLQVRIGHVWLVWLPAARVTRIANHPQRQQQLQRDSWFARSKAAEESSPEAKSCKENTDWRHYTVICSTRDFETSASGCMRPTSAYVSIRIWLHAAYGSERQHTSAYGSGCMRPKAAYVSTYVSIRQHTSEHGSGCMRPTEVWLHAALHLKEVEVEVAGRKKFVFVQTKGFLFPLSGKEAYIKHENLKLVLLDKPMSAV